jgi:hypothetical protein
MSNVTNLPTKGKTYLSGAGRVLATPYGNESGLEGTQMLFDDALPATDGGMTTPRSGVKKTCMLVRNVSGISLERRRIVKWQSGFRNRRVDGYCAIDFEEVAGVVDEAAPSSGIPNHDLFWLELRGPCLVKPPLAASALNVVAVGQPLVALTAATSQATTAGRFQPYAATTGTTQGMSAMLNYIGIAMSAATTANTTTDLLIDLKILK